MGFTRGRGELGLLATQLGVFSPRIGWGTNKTPNFEKKRVNTNAVNVFHIAKHFTAPHNFM